MWYWNDTSVLFNNPGYFFNGATPIPPVQVGFNTLGVSGGRVVLRSKKVGETLGYPVDFISSLAPGETINTSIVSVSVYAGIDPNPSAMITGTPTQSGTVVNQGITGGLLGNIYELLYKVTTSLNQTVEISAFLAVEPDL